MGQETRKALAQMRRRYAANFKVELDLVETEEWQDEGEGKAWSPSRPDLPTWTLNQSEESYFRPEGPK